MTETTYAVKVRFKGERHWYFLGGGGGRLVRLRVHAGTSGDGAKAGRTAAALLAAEAERLAAVRVVDFHTGRVLAHFGEQSPSRVPAPDLGGYRYLAAVSRGRGTFHVKDEAGRWANVSAEVYEACHEEARRAGLDTSRLTVHGCTATISTRGLRFVQRVDNG
jgi:hypothetical protein